jgi:NAD+-dependent protein deacetylase SIR2
MQTGAGISTSAGIPDFRSPDIGLYSNLAHLNLDSPEDVFTIDFFKQNPLPFYTLAHELAPGKFRPTITHSFMSLLNDKGILLHIFTQNIDTLERRAGIPEDKIMEAHGSFASSSCINPSCKAVYPNDLMEENIKKKEIPYCSSCHWLVKPDIVFFGESLPPSFFQKINLIPHADLVIVMGSSLNVAPFSYLPDRVPESVPRILINRELAGTLGTRADDVLYLGDCDDGVRQLAKACGWWEELEAKWVKTKATDMDDVAEPEPEKTTDQKVKEEVELLEREIANALKIAEKHRTNASDQTAKLLAKLKLKDNDDVERLLKGKEVEGKQDTAKDIDPKDDEGAAKETEADESAGSKSKPVL